MNRDRKSQRGIALAAVALFMVVILGFTAIAIDIAHLAHTATEVQTVADTAARAGAARLGETGGTPTEGINRAKLIANIGSQGAYSGANYMNGTASPLADVLVDEGHYDFANHKFQCCTDHGTPATTPCCIGSTDMGGDWACCTGNACPSAKSCDHRGAVIAMPHTTVNNILSGVLDYVQNGAMTASAAPGPSHATTSIEKVAVAGYTGPGQGCNVPAGCTTGDWACYCSQGVAPCLPIGAPSCYYTDPCLDQSCLPALSTSPNGTAAWVTFGNPPPSPSASTVRPYLDHGGCDPNAAGVNPTPVPTLNANDILNANNGISTSGKGNVFDLLQCIVGQPVACTKNNDCLGTNTCVGGFCSYTPQGCTADASGTITGYGGNVFQLPIFDLGTDCSVQPTSNYSIVGFATVRITNVQLGGPVSALTIPHTDTQPTQSGGGCFGTNCELTMAN